MVRGDIDVMYDDLFNHFVSVKTQGVVAPSKWSIAFDYTQWCFRMSHTYMTQDAQGDPPRLTH